MIKTDLSIIVCRESISSASQSQSYHASSVDITSNIPETKVSLLVLPVRQAMDPPGEINLFGLAPLEQSTCHL